MKRFIYLTLGVMILAFLSGVAISVHDQHKQQLASNAQSAATNLQIVKTVDAHNLAAAQTQVLNEQQDNTTLCAFIKSNTKPNIALPTQCQ